MPASSSPRTRLLRRGGAGVPAVALAIVVVLAALPHFPLRAAGAQPQPVTRAVFASDFASVFNAIRGVLKSRDIPVSFASPQRRIIRTGSVHVTQQQLRQLTTQEFQAIVDCRGKQGGRYVLEAALSTPTKKDASKKETSVRVRAMIVMSDTESQGPAGGQVLPSSGVLEQEILMALKKALKTESSESK